MFKKIDYKKLNEVFNKFAGQEVLVNDVIYEVHGRRDGKPFRRSVHRLEIAENDSVITELQKAIEDMGLTLRVNLPGQIGDMFARPDRVNVHIDNFSNDDKYRIGTSYKIG